MTTSKDGAIFTATRLLVDKFGLFTELRQTKDGPGHQHQPGQQSREGCPRGSGVFPLGFPGERKTKTKIMTRAKVLNQEAYERLTPEQQAIMDSWRCPHCGQLRIDELRELYPELDRMVQEGERTDWIKLEETEH